MSLIQLTRPDVFHGHTNNLRSRPAMLPYKRSTIPHVLPALEAKYPNTEVKVATYTVNNGSALIGPVAGNGTDPVFWFKDLSSIVQGTGFQQRVGRQVSPKHLTLIIDICYDFATNPTTSVFPTLAVPTPPFGSYRVIVYSQRAPQFNTAVPPVPTYTVNPILPFVTTPTSDPVVPLVSHLIPGVLENVTIHYHEILPYSVKPSYAGMACLGSGFVVVSMDLSGDISYRDQSDYASSNQLCCLIIPVDGPTSAKSFLNLNAHLYYLDA